MALFRFGRRDQHAGQPAADAAAAGQPQAEPRAGFLDRLRAGLAKTAQVLQTDVRDLFKREGRLVDEPFLEELRAALVRTDMGPGAAEAIVTDVRGRLRARVVDPEVVLDSIRSQLLLRLRPAEAAVATAASGPTVILVTGVNGSGKTTSIGKLAKWFAGQHRSVLLAAGDTFRAAAREQLAVWGARNNVEVVSQSGGDPAAVVFDAVSAAKARGVDVLIADTAGRLPTQSHLMEELKRVKRAQDKALPGAPHEVILIVDGTNGQNALAQVQAFDAAVGLTGLVVTKLDGTAKGGVLVAIAASRGDKPLPILFIGVGEGIDDLQPFSAAEFADALVGPGVTQ